MKARPYDLVVIGGGINGCGIARDAAGRGLSVFLCEQSDLASATSSASTKLIHGGLRYLEYYELRLVREALIEREVLLRAAPHIIWPLRFVLPHHRGLRPAWMIRLGLFLYDHLGGREILPGTRSLDLRSDPAGRPLTGDFTRGFEYSDCWVEDSRLVVANVQDARARGAEIRTRTRFTAARRERLEDGSDGWVIELEDLTTGARESVSARAVVNAAGPWVSEVLSSRLRMNAKAKVRLVKGSHIVTRRLFDHDRAYIFQNTDGRIVFAIPYERDFTLIGTTDQDFTGDPAGAAISEEETAYLCKAVAGYLKQPVSPEDVVHSFAGVRPLYDDGSSDAKSATRDYVIHLETQGGAPLVNVFGGKITTFRRLSESVMAKLQAHFPDLGPSWTGKAALPGGDFAVDGVEGQVDSLRQRYPFLDRDWALRLVRAYGTRAGEALGEARQRDDLGENFGSNLHAAEVAYLMDAEWALTAEDLLWRRSKLGLRVSAEEARRLDDWMRERAAGRRAPARADGQAGGPARRSAGERPV